MSVPFDFIAGEKMDLAKQEHRDVVVNRNKRLERALSHGLEISSDTIVFTVSVKLDCVKCGTKISEYATISWSNIDDQLTDRYVPNIECNACKTRYVYDARGVFYPKIKPLHKSLKKLSYK